MKKLINKWLDKCIGDKDHGIRSLPKYAKIWLSVICISSFLFISYAVYT